MMRAYFETGSGSCGCRNLQNISELEIALHVETNPPSAVADAFGSSLSGLPFAMEGWDRYDGFVMLGGGG